MGFLAAPSKVSSTEDKEDFVEFLLSVRGSVSRTEVFAVATGLFFSFFFLPVPGSLLWLKFFFVFPDPAWLKCRRARALSLSLAMQDGRFPIPRNLYRRQSLSWCAR